MFRYQVFHMTLLTLSFYALLHPDSIKNGLTALSEDWGRWEGGGGWGGILCLSSVLNNVTNGKPCRTYGGITQRRGLSLQKYFGCKYFFLNLKEAYFQSEEDKKIFFYRVLKKNGLRLKLIIKLPERAALAYSGVSFVPRLTCLSEATLGGGACLPTL